MKQTLQMNKTSQQNFDYLDIYLKILTPKNQMDRKEFRIGLLHHQLDKARFSNRNKYSKVKS